MAYTNHNRSVPEPSERNDHMKLQVHSLEKEAYSCILKAFIAQSDLLTWAKEGLITELRKELNVTDSEHGELLVTINSDESIKMIREWRKGAHCTEKSLNKVNASGYAPISAVDVPQKKLKSSHASVSLNYVPHGQLSVGTSSQKYVSPIQPFSGSLPSLPAQFTDNKRSKKSAMFSSGIPEQVMRIVSNNNQSPVDGRQKGSGKSQLEKGLRASKVKRRSDVIQIRSTDKVLKKVEKTLFGTQKPSPVQVEKAKLILNEHESAILGALDNLADVSDGDDYPDKMQHGYSHKELPGHGQRTVAHHDFYNQLGRSNNYHFQAFAQTNHAGPRVPCVNMLGDK